MRLRKFMPAEHERTYVAGVNDLDAGRQPFQRWAKDETGQFTTCETGGCSSGFNNFEPFLEPVEEYYLGSRTRVLDARLARKVATKLIADHPRITPCGNSACERCNDAVAGGPVIV